MTLDEIKQAVDAGKIVHWSNDGYTVEKCGDSIYNYYIVWGHGKGHCIGLTWLDGITLNGQESEFYIAPNVL